MRDVAWLLLLSLTAAQDHGFPSDASSMDSLATLSPREALERENLQSGRLLYFDVCGGYTNQLYAIVHAGLLASRYNYTAMIPVEHPSRYQGDSASQRGWWWRPVSWHFNVTTLPEAFYNYDNKVSMSPADQTLLPNGVRFGQRLKPSSKTFTVAKPDFGVEGARLQQWTWEQWDNLLLPIVAENRTIDVGCTYMAVCSALRGLCRHWCGSIDVSHDKAPCCPSELDHGIVQWVRAALWQIPLASRVEMLAAQIRQSLASELDGEPFNALHLRVEVDWLLSLKNTTKNCFVQAHDVIDYLDHPYIKDKLGSKSLYVLGDFYPWDFDGPFQVLKEHFDIVTKHDLQHDTFDGLSFDNLGQVDFLVARDASYFIGNGCSSMSILTGLWREDQGMGEDSWSLYSGWPEGRCESARWGWSGPWLETDKAPGKRDEVTIEFERLQLTTG